MIRSLNSFDLKDKRVLIRVDYNVPVENGVVKDAYRIQCSIPTIKECLEAGASVVLMSHLGRPNGSTHRSHASNVGVSDNFMHKGMGLLMEKEIQYLMHKFKKPKEPLVLLLGGAKISDKIDMIERFIIKAKSILIGGGMTFTFLKAMGLNVGKSMIDESMISTAKTIIKKARQNRVKIKLPVDFVVSDAIDKPSKIETVSFDSIPDNMIGLDIGPETIKLFSNIILQSGTVLWNGPMGVFEKKEFENGTKSIANLLSDMKDQNIDTIVGGGDSASAIRKFSDIENITHVSTGGGASLELLGGKSLPAITALEKL